MSDDTFDKYVREGVLPCPKRRGKLKRWKWSEIVAAIDGGPASIGTTVQDEEGRLHIPRLKGVERREAARGRMRRP
jgi:hypothetical protein